jgi:thiosulfate reductase cytochrome b subunit
MKKVYLHTLTIRLWHWINAFIVMMLTITGLQLRVPGAEALPKCVGLWVPDYTTAVLIHKYFGYALAASFIFWVVYVIVSGSFRTHYLFRPSDIPVMGRQAYYYVIGLFKGEKNPFVSTPEGKFNPLQKITYGIVMPVILLTLIITGILFSDIFYFRNAIENIGGVRMLDAVHVIAAYLCLLNMLVHLYMTTMGHHILDHIKSMIVGYEEEPDEEYSETESSSPSSPEKTEN